MMRNDHESSLFQLAAPFVAHRVSQCMFGVLSRAFGPKNFCAYGHDTMMGRKSSIRWSLLSSDTSDYD